MGVIEAEDGDGEAEGYNEPSLFGVGEHCQADRFSLRRASKESGLFWRYCKLDGTDCTVESEGWVYSYRSRKRG